MLWSISIGSIAGTAIRLHITFVLFLAWMSTNGAPRTPQVVYVSPLKALTVDIETPKGSGQLLFVDYGNSTYIIVLVASPSQFEQMRSGDFAAILSSWQWR